MPIQATDAFTDANNTLLQSHTAGGVTWTRHPTRADNFQISSNRIRSAAAGGTRLFYYASTTPVSADIIVSADLTVVTDDNLSEIGVAGREDTSAETCYYLDGRNASNDIVLGKIVAGTVTALGTYIPASWTGTMRLVLQMQGTALTGYVAGISRISVTDSDITAIGRPGVRGFQAATATTGVHLDNWQVDTFDRPQAGRILTVRVRSRRAGSTLQGRATRDQPVAPPTDRPLAGRILALRQRKDPAGMALRGTIPHETPTAKRITNEVITPVTAFRRRGVVLRGAGPRQVPAVAQDRPPTGHILAAQVRRRRGVVLRGVGPRIISQDRPLIGRVITARIKRLRNGSVGRGFIPRQAPTVAFDRPPTGRVLTAQTRRPRAGSIDRGAIPREIVPIKVQRGTVVRSPFSRQRKPFIVHGQIPRDVQNRIPRRQLLYPVTRIQRRAVISHAPIPRLFESVFRSHILCPINKKERRGVVLHPLLPHEAPVQTRTWTGHVVHISDYSRHNGAVLTRGVLPHGQSLALPSIVYEAGAPEGLAAAGSTDVVYDAMAPQISATAGHTDTVYDARAPETQFSGGDL